MKRILIYLFFSIFIFSNTLEENKILEIALKNIKFSCKPQKKVIKFEGVDFIGHFDLEGNPYGEWSLKNGKVKQCFLENEETSDLENSIYKKENKELGFTIIFVYETEDIGVFLGKNEKKDFYFFKKSIDGDYVSLPNRGMLPKAIKPLYTLVKILD